MKRTVLKSVVGTLDLSIRYLLHGETFPGVQCYETPCQPVIFTLFFAPLVTKFLIQERVKAPLFCSINRTSHNRYGYVANLCVAKSARRQGIASNMLHLAVKSATSDGKMEVKLEFLSSFFLDHPKSQEK